MQARGFAEPLLAQLRVGLLDAGANHEHHVMHLGIGTRVTATEHHHEQTEIFKAHGVGLAVSAKRRPKPMNSTPASLSSHCMPRAAQRLLRTRSAANT